jgi:hypothetical protein
MDPRLRLLALVLALTVIFHQTLAQVPFGLSLSLFSLAYLFVFHAAIRCDHKQGNRWASFFLIPAAATIFAASWYSSTSIRLLEWLLLPTALAFFSYWRTAPARSLREAFSFTPFSLVQDTIWPFRRAREHFILPKQLSHRHVGQALLGIIFGFPILWIVAELFAAADATFFRLLDRFTRWDFFPTDISRLVLDALVGLFLVCLIGTALRRRQENTTGSPETLLEGSTNREQLPLQSFLIALNALFFVFVGIQVLYVIQGSGHWLVTGLTYADYAKQSFYQLFWVGVIVLGLTFFVYRYTNTRLRLTRILLLTLLAQTGAVLISAWTRLSLYISAYDLTVARWWGGIGLICVGALLAWCVGCLLRQASIARFLQGLVLGSFFLSLPLVLLNHEGRVAYYNVNRYLRGETQKVDAAYLLGLSSDAVPALLQITARDWSTDPALQLLEHHTCNAGETNLVCLKQQLEFTRQMLEMKKTIDWRLLTRNDWYLLERLTSTTTHATHL